MSRHRWILLPPGVFLLVLFAIYPIAAFGEKHESKRNELDAKTVTILSGDPAGTQLQIATDISNVVDHADKIRVLPIVGKGGAQNIRDLISLRNIDMAIVRSDTLAKVNEDGVYGDLRQHVRHIARLYNEEMHVLARKEITSFDQLRGRKVNLSLPESGTQLTARIVFDRLGIEFTEVNMSQRGGIQALKDGQVDATILVAGKPSGFWRNIEIDTERFHFVPVPWPESLQEFYLPTTLDHADYPNLIAEGGQVETIAAGAVLAAYNWEPGSQRYRQITHFVEHFFEMIDEFGKPGHHPKWRDINIAAEIPDWQRFEAAAAWLRDNQNRSPAKPASQQNITEIQQQFNEFLTLSGAGKNASEAEKKVLFEQFMIWRNANTKLTATQ